MILRRGTKGHDTFSATVEAEQFDGLGGYDRVVYAAANASVTIDISDLSKNTGFAAGDTYINIRSFGLSTHNDAFFGGAGKDVVNGDNGDDRLDGNGDNNSLTGHSGNDVMLGGAGLDALWGGGGADWAHGGSGDDQIWGDSGNDTLTGGTDAGTVSIATVNTKYYQYAPNQFVLLSKIDDFGEWVEVPKYHNVEEAGRLTSIARAEGDAIFVLTNGFNSSRNWNAQNTGQPVDLGPSGQISADKSVIFNMGQIASTATVRIVGEVGRPGPQVAGYNADGVVVSSVTTLSSIKFGDVLTGGSGADTFAFAAGDGVDRITDFQIGVDRIDLNNAWFDRVASNGEYLVRDYQGGALIVFKDTSTDGFVDNTAIYLAGRTVSSITDAIFI